MKKILPIATEIPIKTYNNIAYPLSIIFSNFDKPEEWLFLNSFSLKYGIEANDITLDLPCNMNWECFDKKILSLKGTTIENIKKEILEKRYVYIAVDEIFMPYRDTYQKKNFVHDTLVYGFDDSEQQFMLVGHDKKHKYTCHKIEYKTLEKAVDSANSFLDEISSSYEFFGAGNNFSLKMKNCNAELPQIDYKVLHKLLKKYFREKNMCIDNGYIYYSGIEIFDKLQNDVDALIDYRNWSIIKEHINFVLRFIQKYFPEFAEILLLSNYDGKNILQISERGLNYALKYKLDPKNETIEKIKNLAKLLSVAEKEIFSMLDYKIKILNI